MSAFRPASAPPPDPARSRPAKAGATHGPWPAIVVVTAAATWSVAKLAMLVWPTGGLHG
jgi:hypothetical protein